MMVKLGANLSRIADAVFGYDFFISYKRADGENYPQSLERALTKLGYAVFLDTRSYAAGEELSTATRRRVRMSSTLVLLGRPGAFADSPWVLQEVREAHLAGRVLVMINFAGVFQSLLAQGPEQLTRLEEFRELFRTRLHIPEPPVAGDAIEMDGTPSEQTITKVQGSLHTVRQDKRRTRFFGALGLVFAALLVFSSIELVRALRAEKAAQQEARAAKSGQLAALAQLRRPDQPLTAAELAVQAVETTYLKGEATPSIAREALLESLAEIGGEMLLAPSPKPLQRFDVSADNQWLAGEDADGVVFVWNLAAARSEPVRIKTQVHTESEPSTIFPRLRGFDGNTLIIWNDTGCPEMASSRLPACLALATRPDLTIYEPDSISINVAERTAITTGKNDVWVWRDPDHRGLLVPSSVADHLYTARHAVFASDGRSALVMPLTTNKLWGLTFANRVKAQGLDGPRVRGDEILSVSGRNLFISADDDGGIFAWTPGARGLSGVRLRPSNPADFLTAIAASADGDTVAISFDHKVLEMTTSLIEVWHKGRGWTQASVPRQVSRLRLSESGNLLFALSNAGTNVYETAPGVLSQRWSESNERVSSFVASSNGLVAAVGEESGEIRLIRPRCRVETVLPLRGHQQEVSKMAITADGHMLYSLSRDGMLRRWNLEAPRPGDPLAIQGRCNSENDPFSGDNRYAGNLLLAGEDSGTVTAVDLSNPSMTRRFVLPDIETPEVSSPSYEYGVSADGSKLFLQTEQHIAKNVRVYERSPTEFAFTLLHPVIEKIDSSAIDDTALYVSRGNSVYRLRHKGGGEEKLFSFPATGNITVADLALSPDSGQLAVIDYSTVYLWNLSVAPGAAPQAKITIEDAIRRVHFLPKHDGMLLQTNDKELFWRPDSGVPPVQIASFPLQSNVYTASSGEVILVEQPNMPSGVSLCQTLRWNDAAKSFYTSTKEFGDCQATKALLGDGDVSVRQTARDHAIVVGMPGNSWLGEHQVEVSGTVSGVALSRNKNVLAIGTDGAVTMTTLSGPDAFESTTVRVGTENVRRLIFGEGDRWLFSESESLRKWPTGIPDGLKLLKDSLQPSGALVPQ